MWRLKVCLVFITESESDHFPVLVSSSKPLAKLDIYCHYQSDWEEKALNMIQGKMVVSCEIVIVPLMKVSMCFLP